jgi:hypothetical protein
MNFISRFVSDDSDGCVVCLEKDDTVLTDKCDRPIILSKGLIYGSLDEMILQAKFAIEEAKKYNTSEGLCAVIEVDSKSFRFPERRLRKVFSYLMKEYSTEFEKGVIHFIHTTRLLRCGLKLAFPFLPLALKSKVVVHKNKESFFTNLPNESKLKRWGGTVQFSLTEYMTQKCEQVGEIVSQHNQPIDYSQIQEAKKMLYTVFKHETDTSDHSNNLTEEP